MDAPCLCPQCGQLDQLVSVPALVRGGTWSSQSVGGHVTSIQGSQGHNSSAYGVTVHQVSGASNIARLLSPPPRPLKNYPIWFTVALPLGFIAIGATIASLSADAVAIKIALIVFVAGTIGCVAGGIADLPERGRDFSVRMAQWDKEMVVWSRLFYCGRCDLVNDPATGQRRRSHQWQGLLAY